MSRILSPRGHCWPSFRFVYARSRALPPPEGRPIQAPPGGLLGGNNCPRTAPRGPPSCAPAPAGAASRLPPAHRFSPGGAVPAGRRPRPGLPPACQPAPRDRASGRLLRPTARAAPPAPCFSPRRPSPAARQTHGGALTPPLRRLFARPPACPPFARSPAWPLWQPPRRAASARARAPVFSAPLVAHTLTLSGPFFLLFWRSPPPPMRVPRPYGTAHPTRPVPSARPNGPPRRPTGGPARRATRGRRWPLERALARAQARAREPWRAPLFLAGAAACRPLTPMPPLGGGPHPGPPPSRCQAAPHFHDCGCCWQPAGPRWHGWLPWRR
jgi:hypothetical protein